MATPKLSIGILTYAHEHYIRQSLDSVFSQNLNIDLEVVIADDCSPDSTREILQEYAAKYPQVKLLFQEKNVGYRQNHLDLLNALQGEYVAYLEGDDYWTYNDKLQTQLDFLEANPDHVFHFHAATVIRDGGTKNKLQFDRFPIKAEPETTDIVHMLKVGNLVPSASRVHRNVFKGNYPKDLAHPKMMADTFLNLLLAAEGKMHYEDEEWSVYRLHPGGVTETRTKISELEVMVLLLDLSDKHSKGKWHAEHRSAIQKHYYWLLDHHKRNGDKKSVAKYLKLIKENKAYDHQYHENFYRKVWLETFVPGSRALMNVLGIK